MTVAATKDQGRAGAVPELRGGGRRSCRAAARSRRRARPPSAPSRRSGCRIAASRNGSTRTCAAALKEALRPGRRRRGQGDRRRDRRRRWRPGRARCLSRRVRRRRACAGALRPLPEPRAWRLRRSRRRSPSPATALVLRRVRHSQEAVIALNTAFMTDGAVVRIAKGAQLAKPLLLVFARSAGKGASSPRATSSELAAGARATIIEAHVGAAGCGAGPGQYAERGVGRRWRASGPPRGHAGRRGAPATWPPGWRRSGETATYRAFQLTAATGLRAAIVFVTFKGEGAKLDISGAVPGRGAEHIDTTLVVDHAVPGCVSRELFKGVLADRARGVFQGKVIVRPDAQKSDGKQMAQVLMLSQDAEFDSKPELEIYADDVVCGHGSTAAELDEDLLFYMRSRGIPLEEARAHADRELHRRGHRQGRGRARARGAVQASPSAGWPRFRAHRGLVAARERRKDAHDGNDRKRPTSRARPPTTSRRSAPTSRSCSARSTASRWSISTTAPRRRSRARCSTPSTTPTRWNTPTSIAGCTFSPTPPPRATRTRARRVRRFLNARKRRGDHLHAQRHRGHQPRRQLLWRHGLSARRDEIVLSIMEHHSNIVPWHFHRERNGAVLKWAPIADDGDVPASTSSRRCSTKRTKMVAITHMSNVLGTVVPIKEVVQRRPRPRHPVLVDGSQAAVHLPVDVQDLDCDFYVFTGPQDLRADRHRRALRQAEAPRRHAALHGRRRDDRERAPGRHQLRRAAAQVRGRHAADRAGDRPRRRPRLHDADRARAHRRPRGRAARTTRTPGCASSTGSRSMGPPRTRAPSSPSASTGCTRTTSPPSSTARAWRCAPATTAPSR